MRAFCRFTVVLCTLLFVAFCACHAYGNAVQYISLTSNGNQIKKLNESKLADGLFPEIPAVTKGDYETGWTYDANGNRTSDPSKGITSITYNHLNQPLKFTFEDGSYIEHRYRSDGMLYGRTEREKIITTTVNGGATDSWRWQSVTITKAGDFTLENATPKRLEIDGGYISLTPYSSTSTTVAYNYYVYDNQGSVRAVLNERGELTQATDYSAYGVPSTRYAGTAANNRLHLGLEWQPMKGLSGYYNNARFRDALLAGMFYQQDPLAEKYHPFSPYHYGMNNPNRYFDINGMDIWNVDTSGYARKILDDKEIDEIQMVDSNGEKILDANGTPLAITFEYGTIESQYSWEGLNGGQNDFWRVRGDDNATALFEFLSDNITGSETMVEIGLTRTGIEGDKGLNFISTGHQKRAEPGLSYLYGDQLQYGYTIREITHSHPVGNEAGESDRILKTQIMLNQYINNKPIPKFYIYNVKNKLKLNY